MNEEDEWYKGYDEGQKDKFNALMETIENKILDDDSIPNRCKIRIFNLIKESREEVEGWTLEQKSCAKEQMH